MSVKRSEIFRVHDGVRERLCNTCKVWKTATTRNYDLRHDGTHGENGTKNADGTLRLVGDCRPCRHAKGAARSAERYGSIVVADSGAAALLTECMRGLPMTIVPDLYETSTND